MINKCQTCGAVREYLSGKIMHKCPRCGGTSIEFSPSPTTQEGRDETLLDAIIGDIVQ
jgi:predicted  nucleic acid-binding Zn-ribbon protein